MQGRDGGGRVPESRRGSRRPSRSTAGAAVRVAVLQKHLPSALHGKRDWLERAEGACLARSLDLTTRAEPRPHRLWLAPTTARCSLDRTDSCTTTTTTTTRLALSHPRRTAPRFITSRRRPPRLPPAASHARNSAELRHARQGAHPPSSPRAPPPLVHPHASPASLEDDVLRPRHSSGPVLIAPSLTATTHPHSQVEQIRLTLAPSHRCSSSVTLVRSPSRSLEPPRRHRPTASRPSSFGFGGSPS